jgi:hypothetical protein
MNNKKAVSSIIATVILISLGLVAIGIVYTSARTIITDTLMSPEFSCIDYKTSQPITIQKICYNTETKEIELSLLKISKDPYINKLEFVIDYETNSEKFSCDNSCSNCEILSASAKTYYFDSQDNPQDLTLIADKCILATKQISNCTKTQQI